MKLSVSLSAAILLIAMSAHAQSADITVTKSGPEMSAPDTDVTYLVTITNLGPDDSPGVALGDPIPAGMTFVSVVQTSGPAFLCSTSMPPGETITCMIASLAAGASADFTIVTHIDPGASPGTAFTNIATATSSIDPNVENDAGVTTTFTPSSPADMGVMKSGPFEASPGDDVTYSITLTNGGPNDAANVTLSDMVPVNNTGPGAMTFVSFMQTSGPALSCGLPAVGAGGTVTCTALSYPVGQTATFTLTLNIPSSTPSGAEFTNSASVSSDVDPNVENDVSSISLLVSAVDVSVIKSGPATATAGTDIAYSITIANGGPDDATSVTLIDELPPATTFVTLTQNSGPAASCSTPAMGSGGTVGCSFAVLLPGESAQFTLTIRAGDTASVSNTATGSTERSDTDPTNDSSSVTTTITPDANVAITKSAPATVSRGSNLTYTVTLTNNGASTASSVTLTDTVPVGTTFVSSTQTSGPTFMCTAPAVGGGGTVTCTSATLAPGAAAAFSIVVAVPASSAFGTVITNTATAGATTPDSDASNNSATATTTVTEPIPALSSLALAAMAVGLALIGTVLQRRL